MPLTLLLNWRLWAALVVAVGLAASHWKVYKVGQNEGYSVLNSYKLEQSQQTLKLIEKRDAVSQDLQDKSDQARKAKNAEIDRLNVDLADALDRLRSRPERPSEGSVPSNTPACPAAGATGAQLFREDAEFLVREATRADRLRLDLIECQAAHDRAREALK